MTTHLCQDLPWGPLPRRHASCKSFELPGSVRLNRMPCGLLMCHPHPWSTLLGPVTCPPGLGPVGDPPGSLHFAFLWVWPGRGTKKRSQSQGICSHTSVFRAGGRLLLSGSTKLSSPAGSPCLYLPSLCFYCADWSQGLRYPSLYPLSLCATLQMDALLNPFQNSI